VALSLATSGVTAMEKATEAMFQATQDERGTVHALSQEADELVGDGEYFVVYKMSKNVPLN
jgi:hypothetical protein